MSLEILTFRRLTLISKKSRRRKLLRRKRRKEQREANEVKKATVQANSKEELLEKIKKIDWDSIKAEEKIVGSRVDYSV